MAAAEFGALGLNRVIDIFDAVQDARNVPGNLTFRNRTRKVPALNGDITALFLSQAHIADIIGYNQQAATYQAARVKMQQDFLPKMKFGRTLDEEDLIRLEALEARIGTTQSGMYEQYWTGEAEALLQGIEWREESLLVGMYLDSFAYNRNGVVINITWNMPAALKVTPANAWTDTVNATPIADMLNLAYVRQVVWGKRTDRVTLTTPALRLIPFTAEFQAQMRNFYLNVGQPMPTIPYNSNEQIAQLVGRLVNMDVETYDERYPSHPTDGTAPVYAPFQPLNKVILDTKADDNNPRAKDFAVGQLMEPVVARAIGPVTAGTRFSTAGDGTGPRAWITGTPDLDPPVLTWWAAEIGLPRKKDVALSAVLTVGTVVDPVSTTITF
jgi:hypothetical protein